MRITLENLSGLERKLNIEVPSEQIEAKIKSKLHELASKAKIPGFRPGKAPFPIIQKRYTDGVRADLLEQIIRESYTQALQQEKLTPVGVPRINLISNKPNEHLVYDAIFEIYPEIKLADFSKIEAKKPTAKLLDSDLDEMLDRMRKSQAKWQEIKELTRKSQVGDQLIIDFVATLKRADKEVKPKSEESVKFVLGDGSMWVDFEKPLYGVSSGEEKSYVLQMPDTHMDKELAGNQVDFTVKIRQVYEPILPNLDDEFAQKMKIKEGGLNRLKDEVRTHMAHELQQAQARVFRQDLMDRLLDANPVEVPKTLLEIELERLAKQWQQRFASGANQNQVKPPEFPKSDFVGQAKRSVSLGLLLSEIARAYQITVRPDEVRHKIEELLGIHYKDKDQAVEKYLADRKQRAEIESLLLEEKIIAYLASKINLVESNLTYKELMSK